jgi:hypothetical protein
LFCTLRTRKRCEMRHEGRLMCVHNVLNEVSGERVYIYIYLYMCGVLNQNATPALHIAL